MTGHRLRDTVDQLVSMPVPGMVWVHFYEDLRWVIGRRTFIHTTSLFVIGQFLSTWYAPCSQPRTLYQNTFACVPPLIWGIYLPKCISSIDNQATCTLKGVIQRGNKTGFYLIFGCVWLTLAVFRPNLGDAVPIQLGFVLPCLKACIINVGKQLCQLFITFIHQYLSLPEIFIWWLLFPSIMEGHLSCSQ